MTTRPGDPNASLELNPDFTLQMRKFLFDDVWNRPSLSRRERSLITVAALMALYRTDYLRKHVLWALENGITRNELVAVIEHLSFYTGLPCSANAYEAAKQVFEQVDRDAAAPPGAQ